MNANERRRIMAIERADQYERPQLDKSWMLEAACRGMDPELFFGEGHGTNSVIKEARRMCYSVCTVRLACLEYALGAGENLGVWGGTTPKRRARIVRERRREAS